ncbi:MAG: NUDIX domain-containing protein [Deltaproteobacteria bacterium]|nr:NUDIX domain-containing protein [Deltaproteobacteria bacterium]
MIPVVAVGAIVFDGEGRVLLIERGNPPNVGLWSVPGGRLEGAETLAQAVAREVREETGLLVEVGALSCVVERMGDDHHFVILDYLARVIGGTLAAASDARAARFVPTDELSTLPLTDGLLAVLERARATHAAWSTSH